ncbi:PREDICTED: uncharacterized protein LOC109482613 [Branchiostoma belcheri]|uniref:Uncharacterized protein LOC109482613 n=1 Tax=Branchiostoma belcheri TaxID=7741 RepID=A0A6P4ZVN9_BRABE|nr:PREDICTED: uncharacterized protein LOC109482613 [Branchiostoma belcheri]
MSKQGVKDYFIFIKNKVSSDWKDLAWCLGFDTPDIDNIEGKRHDDKSRCMDLLQQWYKREGKAATIHVLMKALQEAELQHVVDSLKDKYPELTDLPVHVNLGTVQDINARVSERLLELETTLFTPEVLRDRRRYKKILKLFQKHKVILKEILKGSVILLLTFLRQTDVDRFYHNHYRVGEGTLSQQLSHILISDDLRDMVKGSHLIVRLHVKHEDYVRVRDRLGQKLDRSTSVDNLLTLPPPSRHVDRSSLRGLDLAVIGREDQPCTDGTDDITMPYRQVQSAVRTAREKYKQEVKVQLETMQGQVQTGRIGVDAMMKEVKMLREEREKAQKILLEQKAEMNEKIQQLEETNKEMETTIEKLRTAKQPLEGARGSQQKDRVQTMSDQHPLKSVDRSTATNTEQVKQSVVQPERKDASTNVRPVNVGQPWVEKVSFGGRGSSKFDYPIGVTVSEDNEVYIADYSNSRIQVFAMGGVYIREFTPTLPGESNKRLRPEDVAVDRNDLWVVSKDRVVQYSREGTSLATIHLPCVEYVRGVTVVMATEQVIVTEYDGQNGRLRVFNQDGSEVGTYGSGHRSPEPWWPRYVTVDGEGNILVTGDRNHCVHVLDREGNFKFKFGSEGCDDSQFKSPQGICVDGMGNIIVADRGNCCVKMFDSQGRFLCHVASGMKGPKAVAVSPGGDVVVTDRLFPNVSNVSVWTQG